MNGRLLENKLALVTGAASGIGRAIALAYAREGARVILTDRSQDACEATLVEVRAVEGAQQGGWAFALDVTDPQQCASVAERVRSEIGDIDVLVNSAGILVREGLNSPHAHQVVRDMMDVNYFGTFNAIHAFMPALRAQRGCIVNIASGAATRAHPAVGYSASKGAVKMLTQAMAADLGKDGVRVNAIAPGVIETPMTEATRNDPERLGKFVAGIPLRRIGQPEEIAGPAVFLASPLASYVNGVFLLVDGGAQA